MQIDNSVVAITGAASGIGRSLAEAFVAAGAKVVLGDLDSAGLTETADRIAAGGGEVRALRVDAAATADLAAMIAAADRDFGPVDVFVANAGIVGGAGLGTEAEWDRILDVNLRAHIRAATLLLPQWQQRGHGHFVGVASAAGLLTQIGAAGYAVTKHAAVGFAEWLAVTYGDDGIGVTCVCPMGVDTPLLTSIRESPDATARVAANSVVSAGAVLTAREVADLTVAAVADGRFLVLPHPEVREMAVSKLTDHDRWIAGMRRYQQMLRG
ncbi:SDR family oxidoreductase [Mycobacterium sp. WMMD1722]|uniref:SDR family oxidoreductase n=1 Tax=Mycobacterium sp. WMMD1722 TaxID=3404117 RepID=UPI003BF59B19